MWFGGQSHDRLLAASVRAVSRILKNPIKCSIAMAQEPASQPDSPLGGVAAALPRGLGKPWRIWRVAQLGRSQCPGLLGQRLQHIDLVALPDRPEVTKAARRGQYPGFQGTDGIVVGANGIVEPLADLVPVLGELGDAVI